MPLSAEPYSMLEVANVRGLRMAYIDEGKGEPIFSSMPTQSIA